MQYIAEETERLGHTRFNYCPQPMCNEYTSATIPLEDAIDIPHQISLRLCVQR
jgi:hypothetical protein